MGKGQIVSEKAAMKQFRFTDELTIGLLKKAEEGMSVKELCKSSGF